MLSKILSYGFIAGLVVGIPLSAVTVLMHHHEPWPWGAVIGYLTMLIALSAVFAAIKRYRDADLGGVIKFWPAFAMGLGVSFVASVLYVVSWEATLAITHLDFASEYSRMMIQQEEAKGVTGAALAQYMQQMEQFKMQYANPLYRLPMTFAEIFPVGVIVSLLSALLLQNRRFLPVRRA